MIAREHSELRELILARMSDILHSVYKEDARGCSEPGIVGLCAFKEDEDLNDLRLALDRLDRGGFGQCIWCHGAIPVDRLRGCPTAHFCPDCERLLERGRQVRH